MRLLGLWLAYHAAVAGLRDAYRARDLSVRARRALARELGVAPLVVEPPARGVGAQWSPLVGTGLYPAPEASA